MYVHEEHHASITCSMYVIDLCLRIDRIDAYMYLCILI